VVILFKLLTLKDQLFNQRIEIERLKTTINEVAKATIRIDEIAPEVLEKIKEVYPVWIPGQDYALGEVVRYNEVVYKVVQAHTSQSDWTPDIVPALFTRISPAPEIIPEWVQPTGAHDAYNTGDRVIYEGQVYESQIDGNIWSPTDYPVGWKAVS
jgi:vesicle coat complex subunit